MKKFKTFSHSNRLSHLALFFATVLTGLVLAACGGHSNSTNELQIQSANSQSQAESRAELGRLIFTDANLSEPPGTACANCHQNKLGFAGNNGGTHGVSIGSLATSIGTRNAMTNSYLGLIPNLLTFVTTNNETEALGDYFGMGALTPRNCKLWVHF